MKLQALLKYWNVRIVLTHMVRPHEPAAKARLVPIIFRIWMGHKQLHLHIYSLSP
jgi:hypothetical protein